MTKLFIREVSVADVVTCVMPIIDFNQNNLLFLAWCMIMIDSVPNFFVVALAIEHYVLINSEELFFIFDNDVDHFLFDPDSFRSNCVCNYTLF